MFQSPSLRGSGRFQVRIGCGGAYQASFNPLHCGAVVASGDGPRTLLLEGPCFNPLHCGAVVASYIHAAALDYVQVFQSPSLRGSGRFRRRAPWRRSTPPVSIPFIAGQWSLRRAGAGSAPAQPRVSIPFIAGQWSLLMTIIEMVTPIADVSIPFIAGQWSLRGARRP